MKKSILFLMLLLVAASVEAGQKLVVINLTGAHLNGRITALGKVGCKSIYTGKIFFASPISRANPTGMTSMPLGYDCCFAKAHIRVGDGPSAVIEAPEGKPCKVKTWKIVATMVNGKLRLR